MILEGWQKWSEWIPSPSRHKQTKTYKLEDASKIRSIWRGEGRVDKSQWKDPVLVRKEHVMIDVIEPARDALELPMTRPPETEKLLSCNLLWQVTCRLLQMIFLNMSSITQLINLVKVKVAIGKGGKCWKNPLRSTGSTGHFREAVSISRQRPLLLEVSSLGSRGSPDLWFEAQWMGEEFMKKLHPSAGFSSSACCCVAPCCVVLVILATARPNDSLG